MTFKPLICLASASPRRSQLLAQIGVPHCVRPAAVDESVRPGEAPEAYVERLARDKAEALWQQSRGERIPVLGADTAVVIEGGILGKPESRDAGLAMLHRLAGRTHRVCTAVALAHAGGTDVRLSVSEVTFRDLAPAECEAYLDSGEPFDKAGGYAVQGLAAVFITRIAGSYSGIMGLPLAETAELLGRLGWRLGNGQGGRGLEPAPRGADA